MVEIFKALSEENRIIENIKNAKNKDCVLIINKKD